LKAVVFVVLVQQQKESTRTTVLPDNKRITILQERERERERERESA